MSITEVMLVALVLILLASGQGIVVAMFLLLCAAAGNAP
jgi:hypothetical protein